jgi:hypothetical protein
MATTKSFWTPELHSGASYYKDKNSIDQNKSSSFGTGLISFGEGIDYDDLDISYRYVNVPLTKILPLLWNMKAWDAKCEYSFSVSDSRDYLEGNYVSPSSTIFSVSNKINGTYSNMENYLDDYSYNVSYATIPTVEPFDKVGGYNSIISQIFESQAIYSGGKIKYGSLLPSIHDESFRSIELFYELENFNILKTHNTDFGSCETELNVQIYNIVDFYNGYSEQGFGYGLDLRFDEIIIRDDGTADVAFDLYFRASLGGANMVDEVTTEYVERESDFGLSFQPFGNYSYTQLYDDGGGYVNTIRDSGGPISNTPITINILGVEKQRYLGVSEFVRVGYNDISYIDPFNPSEYGFNFSFSYDIDVSEFWEYE